MRLRRPAPPPWKPLTSLKMHQAVRDGDAVQLRALLSAPNVDANVEFDDGVTLLHMAVSQGDVLCAKELLSHPLIDPNKANKHGETPLHTAVFNDARRHIVTSTGGSNYTACTAMLLAHADIKPDALDSEGRSPLHHAVYPYAAYVKKGSLEMLLNRLDINVNRPLYAWRASGKPMTPVQYVTKTLMRQRVFGPPILPPNSILFALLRHKRVDISGLYDYATRARVVSKEKWLNDLAEECLKAIAAENAWRRRKNWIVQCVHA